MLRYACRSRWRRSSTSTTCCGSVRAAASARSPSAASTIMEECLAVSTRSPTMKRLRDERGVRATKIRQLRGSDRLRRPSRSERRLGYARMRARRHGRRSSRVPRTRCVDAFAGSRRVAPPATPPAPPREDHDRERARACVRRAPRSVGRVQHHRVAHGETLLDVARDVRARLSRAARRQPGRRRVGAAARRRASLVPSRWILPRSRYRGLVDQHARDAALHVSRPPPVAGEQVSVLTWPIGIGTDEAPSPVGPFTVRSKDANPTWIVPATAS